MVRSSNFASAHGKRHSKGVLFRTAKEAPATLSRPPHLGTPSHASSRSMPAGPSAVAGGAGGLSTLQAIQILLSELEALPSLPRQPVSILSVLRYVALLASLKRAPLPASLLLALEVYFVEFLHRERRRRAWRESISALKLKLRAVSKQILSFDSPKSIDSLYRTECKVPVSKAIDYVQVLRDGKVRFMSASLLVPGDLIHLSGKENFMINDRCPLRELLIGKLKNPPRQLSLSAGYARFTLIFTWILLVASALPQVSIWPLMLLSSQLPFILWWLFSNAHVQLLAKQLVASPTPYAEASEDDEFDEEAPPPVKNVYVSPWLVLKSVFNCAPREESLVEALGLMSVLCFTEREGAISEPFLKPVELVAPSANEAEIIALQIGDSILDGVNDLRAVGLSLLMTSECDQSLGDKHCRSTTPTPFIPEQIQSCYCRIGRQIGFDHGIAGRFKRIRSFARAPHGFLHVVQDLQDSSLHLFLLGELSEVLKASSMACLAPATEVRPLSDSLARKVADFEWTMRSSDVFCAAFAYRPLLPDETNTLKNRKLPATNFIFLGLLATQPEPKPHFQEFIDDLDAAGIRFALFSPSRELASKAFAERLGLETDWNSCILLSDHPHPSATSSGYSALSDIKAKLPRGVSAIRPHLQHVDDIPLHVSIFAECEAASVAEMIKIYQEAGEVVGVVDSFRTSKSIFEGDFRISYDLFEESDTTQTISVDSIANCLHSSLSQLVLPAPSSPYILTELVRESRTLLQNARSAWELFCGICACCCFISRSFVPGLQASLLALSICFAAHDPAVLKTHPLSRSGSLPLYLAIMRFLPFALVSLFVSDFVLMSAAWVQSLCFLNPLRPFSIKQVIGSGSWKISFVHSIALLACFARGWPGVRDILLSTFISSFLFLFQEWFKREWLRPLQETLQKRSKLLFSTKLGMHSPV